MFGIYSKLRTKTLTDVTHDSGVSIFNFEQENASPASFHLFKVNNRNTRKRYKICSKLTIKTPERRQRHCFGVLKVHECRFENLPIYSNSSKNNSLKIPHS